MIETKIATRIKTSARASEHPVGQWAISRTSALAGCLMLVAPVWHVPFALCSSPVDPLRAPGEAGREFVDPCLGSHWRIQSNAEHPGWPGRLVLVNAGAGPDRGGNSAAATGSAGNGSNQVSLPAGNGSQFSPNITRPLAVRAGDRLIVEQDSAVLHAEIEAVALESARTGDSVRVRLSAGSTTPHGIAGKVVSVIATGAGQARWTIEEEVKP
ncbi:hypothetical protein [Acidicapsa acidisoli]|uniref:hypothetical protein n=1 Tax=Acidicapsa acidisoli TaxID=1615681 RepID=UPI0021E08A8F|nr:hypothetical protein [Acidicapsa acidisoli]